MWQVHFYLLKQAVVLQRGEFLEWLFSLQSIEVAGRPLCTRERVYVVDFTLIHPTRERQLKCILSIYILIASREVYIGKTCARGLEYGAGQQAAGRRPRAVLKTEDTVFPNTDRPRPANNVFIILFHRVLCKQFLS